MSTILQVTYNKLPNWLCQLNIIPVVISEYKNYTRNTSVRFQPNYHHCVLFHGYYFKLFASKEQTSPKASASSFNTLALQCVTFGLGLPPSSWLIKRHGKIISKLIPSQLPWGMWTQTRRLRLLHGRKSGICKTVSWVWDMTGVEAWVND